MVAEMKDLLEQEQFKIWVGGERPADAVIGYLEKGSATIKGKSTKVESMGGTSMFPNYFQAWGRRVINGKIPEKNLDGTERTVVNVNDNDYKGEIEWLPSEHKDGYMILGRYVKAQNTLDYHYQINRLGLSKTSDDKNGSEDASFYITLPFGENIVYPKSDRAWAEMLLVTPFNQDSGSALSDRDSNMFRIVRHYDIKKEAVKALDNEWASYTIVKEAASDFKSLVVLKEIMSRKTKIVYDEKDENSLFESLAYYAKEKPVDFLESVSLYKRAASETIEIARTFSVFNTDKDGEIIVKDKGKMGKLISIKGKGEKMIDSLFEICMTHEGFTAIRKLEGIVSKLK